MRMRSALAALFLVLAVPAARAGVATPHRLSFQGIARDASNQIVTSGDVRVRVYDADNGGLLVYDSGNEFAGAISSGVFNVLLGGGTPLELDDTKLYYLELDINGQEVVGDTNGGRKDFWPAGGDLTRTDLENRIATLENLILAPCSTGRYNLNGNPTDGCEFVLDGNGIYVDATDPQAIDDASCGLGPAGTAANCYPCRSIAQGLSRAGATSRSTVYVADGNYPEAVTLVSGKSLIGGFRSLTWERHAASTATVLRGESTSGNHKRAVVGTGVSNVTVDGFVIFGPIATAASGNSYAVYLSGSSSVVLRNNVIYGGVGGPGSDGSAGSDGASGVAGAAGAVAVQSNSSSCNTITMQRTGGAGGALVCSGVSVSGGAGGGTRCSPVFDTESSGIDGVTGANGGGGGGDAGDDGKIETTSQTLCYVPTNPTVGAAGSNGSVGSNGAFGAGSSSPAGSVVGGNWLGGGGASGVAGNSGRGGGGGGAGGGADGIAPNFDVVGGTGGGGGSGGCGGTAGGGGLGGGGSFCVFVSGGAAPTITGNVFVRGYGGAGGRGGTAGRGGSGGLGAAGGGIGGLFCANPGGKGGDGGGGGHGGGGGGGAGGVACGIFTSGVGSPSYAGVNTFSGGAAGSGGPGGLSLGNAGTVGAAGTVNTVVSQ